MKTAVKKYVPRALLTLDHWAQIRSMCARLCFDDAMEALDHGEVVLRNSWQYALANGLWYRVYLAGRTPHTIRRWTDEPGKPGVYSSWEYWAVLKPENLRERDWYVWSPTAYLFATAGLRGEL